MFIMNKARGILWVEDTLFKDNSNVNIIHGNCDGEFLMPIIDLVVLFWKNYIFPVLFK